jgi:RNA polymerase sigma factor (sigma-70 family)
MTGDSDEELMRRFAMGEAAAFEALYERHERRIWRYLTRHLGEPEVAEELMQEVWFTVARQAAVYRPTARFTTWLYTLAHRRMVDALRLRRPGVSLAELDESEHDREPALATDESAGPEAQVAAAADAARVDAALARLPAEQRAALLLHVDGGLGVAEVAAVTGEGFETIKSRLRYARAKLRELLAEER